MKSWSITEARARISDVVDAALTMGPQRIERRDSAPVVVVAEGDWKRLVAEFGTFAELVLESGLEPSDLPERRPARTVAGGA